MSTVRSSTVVAVEHGENLTDIYMILLEPNYNLDQMFMDREFLVQILHF
ncbi:MAG: hypothetical protein K6B67_01815 [Lachnospiraceae bacterium]|nr:hypothetical protein [Lachnospiraceae bacterium]